MGLFGWEYPPGAAGDPRAPYSQREESDGDYFLAPDEPTDAERDDADEDFRSEYFDGCEACNPCTAECPCRCHTPKAA